MIVGGTIGTAAAIAKQTRMSFAAGARITSAKHVQLDEKTVGSYGMSRKGPA